jgi:hypothetical protein
VAEKSNMELVGFDDLQARMRNEIQSAAGAIPATGVVA